MNWGSASEFFAMGGHGLYVWGSFGACLLLMVVEPILARVRRSNALTELRAKLPRRKESQDETTT
jgi:heme exporter protein D